MSALQQLLEAGNLRPDEWPVEVWRERGLQAVGCLCSYVPEEVLVAAGLHPVRITGVPQEGTPRADSVIPSNCCGFLKCALDLALEGGYSFLAGIITTELCENMRRVYEIWRRKVPGDYFQFILSLPRHAGSPPAVARYTTEVRLMSEAIQRHFGTSITEESLWEAIRLYNTTRTLWRQLYERTCETGQRLGSADILRVNKASMWMQRADFNRLLEDTLKEMETAPPSKSPDDAKKRILLSGSVLISPEYFEMIEEMGGMVVADDLSTGSRYFWNLTEETGDPYHALSARYMKRVPCARMFGNEERLAHIIGLLEHFHVDAVIISPLKYCDPHQYSAPIIQDRLEKLGYPVLRLDREYAPSSIGQMKTRVQAFMEILSEENSASEDAVASFSVSAAPLERSAS